MSHVDQVQRPAARIRDNIKRVIVGKEAVIEHLIVALICEGHVLIEDIPGIGKTTLAKALARSIGCSFSRIQCTPDLLPADVTGFSILNQREQAFEFQPGPIFAHIVLVDEINRATPRTQSALLEAMEERQVTIDGVTHPLPRPFLLLATQNPVELEGTFPLPEAQRDRFFMRLALGYPTEEEEQAIVRRFREARPLETLDPVASPDEIIAAARAAEKTYVSDAVLQYAVRIVRVTRGQSGVALGASPRGSMALHRAAQALAGVRGRAYVLPDDIKELAPLILAHRIFLSSTATLHGKDPLAMVADAVTTVPVPAEAAEPTA
jgi:MoxR-like ATPase